MLSQHDMTCINADIIHNKSFLFAEAQKANYSFIRLGCRNTFLTMHIFHIKNIAHPYDHQELKLFPGFANSSVKQQHPTVPDASKRDELAELAPSEEKKRLCRFFLLCNNRDIHSN